MPACVKTDVARSCPTSTPNLSQTPAKSTMLFRCWPNSWASFSVSKPPALNTTHVAPSRVPALSWDSRITFLPPTTNTYDFSVVVSGLASRTRNLVRNFVFTARTPLASDIAAPSCDTQRHGCSSMRGYQAPLATMSALGRKRTYRRAPLGRGDESRSSLKQPDLAQSLLQIVVGGDRRLRLLHVAAGQRRDHIVRREMQEEGHGIARHPAPFRRRIDHPMGG